MYRSKGKHHRNYDEIHSLHRQHASTEHELNRIVHNVVANDICRNFLARYRNVRRKGFFTNATKPTVY